MWRLHQEKSNIQENLVNDFFDPPKPERSKTCSTRLRFPFENGSTQEMFDKNPQREEGIRKHTLGRLDTLRGAPRRWPDHASHYFRDLRRLCPRIVFDFFGLVQDADVLQRLPKSVLREESGGAKSLVSRESG